MSFASIDVMDPEQLMRQAPMTMETYLVQARTIIDGQFGKGYAEKNPQLIAAFITGCVRDYDTSMRVKIARMQDETAHELAYDDEDEDDEDEDDEENAS